MRELSLHILDLVENSLEAGATQVEIEIREDLKQDLFCFRVRDNGRGMDEDTLQHAADAFYTKRCTRKFGFGLPLLKAACERCEGKLVLESKPWQGTIVTATFRYSHWDRAPLGDIATTIFLVLAGRPDVKLYYRHWVDGKSFEFSSEEVKRRLGPVPLNHVAVLDWLKGYLAENIGHLYGGA